MASQDEAYLIVEFDSSVDKSLISGPYEFLDLDTEAPRVQVSGQWLVGKYEPVIGTSAIFNKDSSGNCKYFGQSTKKIIFRRQSE